MQQINKQGKVIRIWINQWHNSGGGSLVSICCQFASQQPSLVGPLIFLHCLMHVNVPSVPAVLCFLSLCLLDSRVCDPLTAHLNLILSIIQLFIVYYSASGSSSASAYRLWSSVLLPTSLETQLVCSPHVILTDWVQSHRISDVRLIGNS